MDPETYWLHHRPLSPQERQKIRIGMALCGQERFLDEPLTDDERALVDQINKREQALEAERLKTMSDAYMARAKCGCYVAAVVDDSPRAAKEVAKWIRDGLTIEHVSAEFVRANFTVCPHERQEQQLPLLDGVGAA